MTDRSRKKRERKRKTNAKQEKDMWWDKNLGVEPAKDGNKKGHIKTQSKKKGTVFNRYNVTKPTVNQDPETLSVVLYKQSNLNEIAALCKPKAGGSEFQVHYRGVQFVIGLPNELKRLVVTIPTYYFNMPQKVSTGSVDFSLDQVSAISEKIAPLSGAMAEKIVEAFPMKFFEEQGFEIKVKELEMGSIHRHPGDFGFSGTDLDNQVENPGVIFRNLKCQDKIQVDSVMYIPGNFCKIVTTETRVVSVAPSDDEGIEGTYSESPTVSVILTDAISSRGFQDFFAGTAKAETKYDFKVSKKWITGDYPAIEEMFSTFLDGMDYAPGLIVDPNLIEQAHAYHHHNYYGSNYKVPVAKKPWSFPGETEEDDLYGILDENDNIDYHTLDTDKKTPAAKPAVFRPTWRKTQTLGMLRIKGIDVKSNDDITGDASPADIVAITIALKAKKIGDVEIREFFKSCDYSGDALNIYYDGLAKVVEESKKTEPKSKTEVKEEVEVKIEVAIEEPKVKKLKPKEPSASATGDDS